MPVSTQWGICVPISTWCVGNTCAKGLPYPGIPVPMQHLVWGPILLCHSHW